MAFGKDPNDMKKVASFNGGSMEQRAAYARKLAEEQASKAKASSKAGGYFVREFKPSMEMPDYVRLVKGEYPFEQGVLDGENTHIETIVLEYFPFTQHYNSSPTSKKTTVCSGGPFHFSKKHRKACKGCDRFFGDMTRGADGKTKKGPVSKRDMSAFNVVHMQTYHKMEQVDKVTGDIRKNPETGVAYYNWVPCEGRGCSMCRANKETTDGQLLPWAMGDSHKNILVTDGTQRVRDSCVNCHRKDSITSMEWACKSCGYTIIDMNTTTLKDSEIREVVNAPVKCPSCKQEGFLTELIGCSGCSAPTRATIFDVNMRVKRVQPNDGSEQTMLVIVDFDAPGPIPEKYAALAKALPLSKMYAPSTPEWQERAMESSPTATAGARPYNR